MDLSDPKAASGTAPMEAKPRLSTPTSMARA